MRRLREALASTPIADQAWPPSSRSASPGASSSTSSAGRRLGHFGQVRAFADGQAQIDQWHWETNDKAWV